MTRIEQEANAQRRAALDQEQRTRTAELLDKQHQEEARQAEEEEQRRREDAIRQARNDALLAQAVAQKKTSRHLTAVATLSALLANSPQRADALYERASNYRSLGKFEPALDDINQALYLDPANSSARALRAAIYIDTYQHDRARTECEGIIGMPAVTAKEQLSRGMAFQCLKLHDKALEAYAVAHTLEPGNTDVDHLKGQAAYAKGDYQGAIKAFTRGMATDNLSAKLFTARGLAYLAIRDTKRALEDFTFALQLFEGCYAAAINNRGNVYLLSGQYEKALEAYNSALSCRPDYAIPLANRGIVHETKGRKELAVQDYRAALRLDPTHMAASLGLGRLGARS